MSYTVAEALAQGIFKEARVVAGAACLNNIITNAEVMETPLMSKRMHGGEFVLCSGYAFRSDPELQISVIEQFAEKHISAFGIQVGRYFNEVPQCMIDAAEQAGLPLLELPPNYSYMDFLMPFYEIKVENQMQPLRYTDRLHARMIKTMLSGNGTEGIVALTTSQIDHPMMLLDIYGNVCYCKQEHWGETNPYAYAEEMLHALLASEVGNPLELAEIRALCAEQSGRQGVCMRLEAGGTALGYLMIGGADSSLSELHRSVIREAGSFLSLELLKEKAVVEADQDARSSLLEDILEGNYRNGRSVLRRATYLNIDLRGEYVLCFFSAQQGGKGEERAREPWFKDAGFFLHLSQELSMVNENYLIKVEDEGILILSALGGVVDYNEFCTGMCAVKQRLEEPTGSGRLRLCIGNAESHIENLRYSYEDVKRALGIASYFGMGNGIIRYGDVELLLLLSKLRNESIVRNHIERYLRPIIEYDAGNNAELEKTLREYYRNGGNVSDTAKALFLHKNTVQYRLRRIAEITGMDMSRHRDAFMLELCMLLREIEAEDTVD